MTCAEVLSRELVRVAGWEEPSIAARLLLDHGILSQPVVNRSGSVVGVVGLRDLIRSAETVANVMRLATIAAADDPAVSLFSVLTDGTTHSVSILDESAHPLGVVMQTDLLMAMSRSLAMTR